jgi:hypothetical protein
MELFELSPEAWESLHKTPRVRVQKRHVGTLILVDGTDKEITIVASPEPYGVIPNSA